jgi:decaprenyl-phosphate phosphoribosyltransferase
MLLSFNHPMVKISSAPTTTKLKNPYLAALRPHQWTKNFIVFAAPLFAFSLKWQSLWGSLLAFALFCAASSSFYIINDLADVEADRRHPVKCKRPIAAGLVSVPTAIAMAAVLLGSALLIAWSSNVGLGAAITLYALLQVAYNFRLKHTVILDVVAIATGFVLRAYAGAAATDIRLSSWFLVCTAMLALFLGIEKRKAELRLAELKGSTRAVLQRYSPELLARMENTVTTGALMSYTIWSSGPQLKGASTPWMMLTVPLVLYGVFRYQLLSDPKEISNRQRHLGDAYRGSTERPEEVLLTDKPVLLTVVCWVAMTVLILTFKHQGWIQ